MRCFSVKSFKRAFGKKIRGVRPTIVSIILILLATYRLFCSGEGIIISGICASIVPFICQLRNYPAKDEDSTELINVLADYFVNIFYMLFYLAYVLLVTMLGSKLNQGYVQYTYFWGTMLMAVSANMIFISAVYTIGAFLTWKQRMAIGIILVNAQLGIMLLSEYIVCGQPMIGAYCIGFIALIFALTLSFVFLSYGNTTYDER